MSDDSIQIGPISLAKDTILVLAFTFIATGGIVTLSGLGMLANNWNKQAEPDMAHEDYGHGHGDDHHGDDYGGDHGDDHGDEHGDDHGDEGDH